MLVKPAPYSHNYNDNLIEAIVIQSGKKMGCDYSANEAMKTALYTNRHKMSAILNFLGEDITDSKLVDMTVTEYLLLMELMDEKKVDGCVTVKPTALDLQLTMTYVCRIFAGLQLFSKTLASSCG